MSWGPKNAVLPGESCTPQIHCLGNPAARQEEFGLQTKLQKRESPEKKSPWGKHQVIVEKTVHAGPKPHVPAKTSASKLKLQKEFEQWEDV